MSVSLAIRRMPVQTTPRCHSTSMRASAGKQTMRLTYWMGRSRSPCALLVGMKEGAFSHFREKNVSSSNGERRNLRQPAVPLLGMHARELKSSDHTKACTQMFTEACMNNSPNEKQANCPSTGNGF